jgi:tetratricopeptide (TPR) repeat protein
MQAVSKAKREGRLLDAEKLLTAAVQRAEAGSESKERLSLLLNMLANLEFQLHHYSKAIEMARRELAVDRTLTSPMNWRVRFDVQGLGFFCQAAGNDAAAGEIFKQGVELARKDPGPQQSNLFHALRALEANYEHQHLTVDAQAVRNEEIQLCQGQADTQPSPCTYFLTRLYHDQGHAGYAEEMLARAANETPVPQSGFVGYAPKVSALDLLAHQYAQDHLYDKAEAAYRKAIAVVEAASWHPFEAAPQYDNLGTVLEREAKDGEAEAAYLHSFEVREQAPAPYQEIVAWLPYPMLVKLYEKQGRLADAEAIVKRALGDQERVFDANDVRLVHTLKTLAAVQMREGEYSDAAPACARAIKIQEAVYGAESPRSAGTLQTYAAVLRQLGELEKADALDYRANSLQEKTGAPRQR